MFIFFRHNSSTCFQIPLTPHGRRTEYERTCYCNFCRQYFLSLVVSMNLLCLRSFCCLIDNISIARACHSLFAIYLFIRKKYNDSVSHIYKHVTDCIWITQLKKNIQLDSSIYSGLLILHLHSIEMSPFVLHIIFRNFRCVIHILEFAWRCAVYIDPDKISIYI